MSFNLTEEVNRHNMWVRAYETFSKKYPKFADEVWRCMSDKEELEISVYDSDENIYMCIKGNIEREGSEYFLVIDCITYLKDGVYVHYDFPYPSAIWDKDGAPILHAHLEQEAGTLVQFPFEKFLELGEGPDKNYCITRHKSPYGAGKEIYKKFSKLIKSSSKEKYGRRMTEKQILQSLSEIISEACEDPDRSLVHSFQDDTDYGFTSSSDDE